LKKHKNRENRSSQAADTMLSSEEQQIFQKLLCSLVTRQRFISGIISRARRIDTIALIYIP